MTGEQTTTDNSSSDLEASSSPRAVGILLRALLAYSDRCVHSINKSEAGLASDRDFSGEARILHDLLLRCCQALHNFSGSCSDESDRPASLPLDSLTTHASQQRESLEALWEILKDATNLIEAMIETPPVNLQAWTSFNDVLVRNSKSSSAAERFMSAVSPGAGQLHPGLLSLSENIAEESLAADLHSVFSTLSQQLEFLTFIESSMKDRRSLKPLVTVLMLINSDTSALLDHLEKHTLKDSTGKTQIIDVLDGTAYAMRMELRKAFEYELAGVLSERQPHHIYAKLENAHGLLRDCFQQSVVGIAQLFDPDLQGTELFGNFQTKLDQSLSLRRELWRLVRNVRRAAEGRTELNQSPAIVETINTFRENSLRFLMYKDRESFERFFEEIEAANAKPELVHVLHRFEAYLQMLFTQVNMRAVLMNHPFDASEGQ